MARCGAALDPLSDLVGAGSGAEERLRDADNFNKILDGAESSSSGAACPPAPQRRRETEVQVGLDSPRAERTTTRG